jgi:Flp pilus assembly pilin Flp
MLGRPLTNLEGSTMPRPQTPRNREQGQGFVEYAFIILLVALVVFGTLVLLGPAIASALAGVHPAL